VIGPDRGPFFRLFRRHFYLLQLMIVRLI
jgi:hypothetical protein